MDLFSVRPKVSRFDTFREFATEFALAASDLLLTETVMHEGCLRRLNLPCRVVLKDTYDPGEPTDETIDRILADTADMRGGRIVAVGGGSVIDIAKMMMIRGALPFGDVASGKTPIETDRELIVVPTTCGTGSEATNGGIVTMKATGLKTGIMSPKLTASHAVLIPELLEGLPYRIFAHCSIDALAHSMESFLSPTRGNEMARAVAARGIEMILDGYAEIILKGREARQRLLGDFLTASCLGGMAVNNGGAGPVHALAYPLGERHKVSHGESICQFLGPVMRLYREEKPEGEILRRLMRHIAPSLAKAGFPATDEAAFTSLEAMLDAVYPIRRLRECGMTEEEIKPFAESVIAIKQRLVVASYVPFTAAKAEAIYRQRL